MPFLPPYSKPFSGKHISSESSESNRVSHLLDLLVLHAHKRRKTMTVLLSTARAAARRAAATAAPPSRQATRALASGADAIGGSG